MFCSGSSTAAAAAWDRLAAGETEAGLVAADVLAVRWWLEERWLVGACPVVKRLWSVDLLVAHH